MCRVHCICAVQRASSVRSAAANYPSLWRSFPAGSAAKKMPLLLSKPDKNNYLDTSVPLLCGGPKSMTIMHPTQKRSETDRPSSIQTNYKQQRKKVG